MRFISFLILFLIIFVLVNLTLVVTLYRHIYVLPSFSISMSSYNYPNFDPKKSLILPGSLVIAVDKYSPLFAIYDKRPMFDILSFLSNLFLALSILSSVLTIILLVKKEQYLYHAFFSMLSAAIFMGLSIYLRAPAYPKDILCYSGQGIFNRTVLICHQYVGRVGNIIMLKRVYDGVIENVTEDKIIAKVVYVAPPPSGILIVLYKAMLDFMYKLYILITQGNIPLGYKIEYIKVG